MIELNRRLLVYPALGLLAWFVFSLWVNSVVRRTGEQERVGQGVQALLHTTGRYRQRSEDRAAESRAYRAAARLSDARSRAYEDSTHMLQIALADDTRAVNQSAAALGDTGSVASWRSLFERQTKNTQLATVALGTASKSLGECRTGEAQRDSAHTADSLALLACAGRVDSLTQSLADLNHISQCRVLFVINCPTRKEAFVFGAFGGAALYALLRGVTSH